MTIKESWLLPEGIDELMPEEASQLEILHRSLVDRMRSWGYQLVVPPLVEYLDSLLTGTAKTLDIQTFKLTDQMSGRMLGIRADMTPQVARIAAHKLRHQSEILRLCYIGSVLHTLPEGQGKSRNPIQLGAEIYGHAGPESDVESIELMVDLLNVTGAVSTIALDIGHVGIYRGLAAYAGLTEFQEQALFSALQRKAAAEIEALLVEYQLDSDAEKMLQILAELNGDRAVLQTARQHLQKAPASVQQALDTLEQIAEALAQRLPSLAINFDLAELRGYHYHTGVVFAAYKQGSAQAVAAGGRYDDIGEEFGHAQPATGFSMDLKKLATQLPATKAQPDVIGVTWQDDADLQKLVESLRQAGKVVVYQLPGSEVATTHTLVKQDGHWEVAETGTQTRG
ncbi:ATP phosphoribosyltransferase regulatory subunit [Methylophaga thiooxydans]|uniref:ATP phosphoribosyltransferase regulatory subunit n=1 Tax=Methylophaga thiooxydans DMS010 TaxID=637616 RepID=C0N861_9GAMM|nr:ATP phosphoribosyltransferase regulatory subunit [Methylophaga thiooxydans]EEF79100.1 tRNA synthetase class II core domain (G, H, P, S and T) protein [Methylophaga thiooxydans DMS010]